MEFQISLLNSVLPSFATGLGGLYTAFSLLSRKQKDKEKISFAFSWFLMGSVFFLTGLRITAFATGAPELDKNLFYALEICTGLAAGPMMYHVAWKLTRNQKLTIIFTLFAAICGLLFIFFVFKEGVTGPKILVSGSEYTPPTKASFFFILPSIIGLIIVTIDLIKRAIQFFIRKKEFKSEKFLSSLSFFIFVTTAGFDQLGFDTGWNLVIMRIFLMISALIASISYSSVE